MDGGNLHVQAITYSRGAFVEKVIAGSARRQDFAEQIPQIVVAVEQYNRMVRMIQQCEKLKLEVELAVKFNEADATPYHTIAEIPGTDLKDQLVMLGAHLDSWGSGTGATDNAAGVAVCMEAVRILEALKLVPRRTIRVALWSGEENGARGSQAYVERHFGSLSGESPQQRTIIRKPEYDKLSAYYNLDNGAGKIRGVYLQGNAAARPIFREWLAPFQELGAATLSFINVGGTDHIRFDEIGLPGFQFIQDELEYDTRTHHTSQDVLERVQPEDLKKAAIIMAAFIYHTAMRDEPLPRKPMPAR